MNDQGGLGVREYRREEILCQEGYLHTGWYCSNGNGDLCVEG